jgi:hypothetical protein
MGWTGFPATSGTDIQDYRFVAQIPRAIRERYWPVAGNWPPGNFQWVTGTVTGVTDNGDGSYTVSHASDGTATNRWFNFTGHSPTPVNYDLVFDDNFNEDQVVHVRIYGSTATSFKIDSATDHVIADLATGAFLYPNVTITGILSSLTGRTYRVIQRGGEWWHERWLPWPNDQEQWADLALAAGALQPATSLTSDGMTTATAVVTGHQFITGDSVAIAGAVSGGSQFNGTFSVTVVDADTFTYTLAAPDDLVATGTITAKCTAVGAHDAAAAYPAGAWASGYQLMVNGSDTLLKRITLTGNDATNLYFARQSYTVSGQYAVVAATNTLGNPSRWRFYTLINALCSYNAMAATNSPGQVFLWYHSLFDNYRTRLPTNPTDTLGTTKVPANSITLNDGTGTPYQQAVFDTDYFTPFTDTHNPPDKNYTPDYWRTIRSWQVALENLVGNIPAASSYVAPVSYEGAQAIPSFVCATWFEYAGINARRGATSTTSGGGITISGFSGFFPYFPRNVYFAVLDTATGDVISAGTGSVSSATHLDKDVGTFGPSEQSQTLVISLGWTRNYDDEFLYLYDKKCWVPTPDAITGNAIDPPTSASPGSFTFRGKSAKYKEHGGTGIVNEVNGFRSFVDGEFARYSGDNWNDPTIHPEIPATDTHGFQSYYNNFYEGLKDDATQAALTAVMAGTVTDSDTMWIADGAQNWWPGGVLHTESGTATGGSTADLTDTTKNGNGFWGLPAAGMLGNVVKVTISGIDYYRVVTAHFGNSPAQIFWGDALPSSASGKTYSIRWPKYEMNRWNGLTLHMVYPDASIHDVAITASDDQRIFFTALASAPPVGTTYTITGLHFPGGVWQWSASQSKWIVPTGNDPRTGTPWMPDQTANLPTRYTNYGRFMKGDYVQLLFDEMQRACNALVHTKAIAGWSSQGANNYQFGQVNGEPDAGGTGFGTAQTTAKANYAGSGGPSSANPFACSYTKTTCNGGGGPIACYDYAVGRRYAYGTATNAVNIQSSGTDWYAFSVIPANPATGGLPGQPASGSCPAVAVFDANGDGAILNAWHRYSSDGASSSSSRASGTPMGDTGLPAPTDVGPAPASCPTNCSWYQGYVVQNNGICIFRWNVGGGGFNFR